MGQAQGSTRNMVNSLSDLDDNTVINQGTTDLRQPQLGFHSIHGLNVELKKGSRVARRKESFCKGLAFSNRPISIEENVCLRLTEVATNWSGVLRFGVTNVDPETFRNMPVPKFACPDLTSKDGYWAKALPERYSVEGNILHFYVTSDGELFYGINGTQKGIFLVTINTARPLWIIVDIYGNSVGVEFVDPSDFRPPRNSRAATVTPRITAGISNPSHDADMTNSSLAVAGSGGRTESTVRFHHITGTHISLSGGRMIAERCEQEYTQGYVFTERPIANNEKVTVQVMSVQTLYSGGMAFGVTCCDPNLLRTAELPDDSSDLIEMPQYWVGIKDIGVQPRMNSILSFWITDSGEVKFEKDGAGARTVLHVDNSLSLYMWFDCYGSTQTIKLVGATPIARSHSPSNRTVTSGARVALPAIPQTTRREPPALPSPRRSETNLSSGSGLRVDLRNSTPTSSANNFVSLLDTVNPHRPPRRTIDDLLLGPIPATRSSSATTTGTANRPPPIAPRPSVSSSTFSVPTPPSRPPPPTPTSISDALPTSPPAKSVIPPAPTIPAPPRPSLYEVPFAKAPAIPSPTPTVSSSSSRPPNDDMDVDDECTVCMSARINSVIYKCGHMCMCYPCARQTMESSGQCPLCRTPIVDVIKCFKS